jgi:Zn-dependent peptidase ImmA (M78 family)
MNFSRMDLADCVMPEALLAEIHKLQTGVFPIPVPIEEWALALDITAIQALETKGFEGGLMMFPDRSSGTILVNEANGDRRRRFTIGHELGHFLLPWHTPRSGQGFMCSAKDMAVFRAKPGGDRYIEMEAQANQFSAGILMPAAPFRADLRARRHFEASHIVELSDRYDVSKEAMARRCVDLHDDAIAVVFSRAGVVMRAYRGKDFPRLGFAANDPLPAGSIAKRATLAAGQSSAWGEGPAHHWLENIRGTVAEQSIGQQNGYRMTLLTFEADSDDQDDDEEEVEKAWSPPRFSRR